MKAPKLGLYAGCLPLVLASCQSTPPQSKPVSYVGSAACGECHAEQQRAWRDSAHAWAMKESKPELVLGRFDGSSVSFGREAVAHPQTAQDGLAVEVIDGGEPQRFALRYFLGREAIEQHLAAFPNGRLQALPVGYDTVRKDWFDIFADDPREPDDWGYWANAGMTANSECLFCHTTGFEKGYDLEHDSFDTRWSEMGVGCEACHGPGSSHVEAQRNERSKERYALSAERMFDACASCHSLRREIWPGFKPGDAFLDYFDPVLLDEGDYHPDGQVLGESYEWGSFLQSRMYQAGVRCMDCHEPHGATTRKQGDGLCIGCHEQSLATPDHTHHPLESEGARCLGCHMPEHVFMTRDARRDHSFFIPDPRVTGELGVPNACGQCHAKEDKQWAAGWMKQWFGDIPSRDGRLTVAKAFASARDDSPAMADLLTCATNCDSAIVRATALQVAASTQAPVALRQAEQFALRDSEPLVRLAAMRALEDSGETATFLAGLDDELRAIRLHAAWGLRSAKLDTLEAADAARVKTAWDEWERSTRAQADDAESHHAFGIYFTARDMPADAEAAYRTALRLAPGSIPARYNLAYLLLSQERLEEAQEDLRRIQTEEPRFADASCALGSLHTRREEWKEAVSAFTICLKAAPNYPGALYGLSRAYVKQDKADLARFIAEQALKFPYSRKEAFVSLVQVSVDLEDRETARSWADQAVAEFPDLASEKPLKDVLAD